MSLRDVVSVVTVFPGGQGVVGCEVTPMFDVLYPGRRLVINSPLSVEEVAQRLGRDVTSPVMRPQLRDRRQERFEGTFADGQFSIIRRVHGRNSFRPWMKGRLSAQPAGTRIDLHVQLHLFVLIFGVILAIIAGSIAAIAAPELPVVTNSPLMARLLAMALIAVIFAALGRIEARTATRLLEKVVGATPGESRRVSQQTVAAQR